MKIYQSGLEICQLTVAALNLRRFWGKDIPENTNECIRVIKKTISDTSRRDKL